MFMSSITLQTERTNYESGCEVRIWESKKYSQEVQQPQVFLEILCLL